PNERPLPHVCRLITLCDCQLRFWLVRRPECPIYRAYEWPYVYKHYGFDFWDYPDCQESFSRQRVSSRSALADTLDSSARAGHENVCLEHIPLHRSRISCYSGRIHYGYDGH